LYSDGDSEEYFLGHLGDEEGLRGILKAAEDAAPKVSAGAAAPPRRGSRRAAPNAASAAAAAVSAPASEESVQAAGGGGGDGDAEMEGEVGTLTGEKYSVLRVRDDMDVGAPGKKRPLSPDGGGDGSARKKAAKMSIPAGAAGAGHPSAVTRKDLSSLVGMYKLNSVDP
jgi:hypothetical protein